MLEAMLTAVAMTGAGLEGYDPPHWIAKPTGDDVARVYPRHAALAGIAARVLVKCGAGADQPWAGRTLDRLFISGERLRTPGPGPSPGRPGWRRPP